MKNKSIKIFGLLTACLISLPAMQATAQGPDINAIFSNFKNMVIAGANQIAQWKTEAEAAARKTVNDFTDCPSPAAQNLYNDLKNKLNQAREVKRQAEEADRQAAAARDKCKRDFPMFTAQCDAAYNGLSFKATAGAAAGTIGSLEAALNALKALKCPAGCNRTAKVVYPYLQMGQGNIASTTAGFISNVTGIGNIGSKAVNTAERLVESISYCSLWEPGQLQANWDAGNGEMSAGVRAKLPKCKEEKRLSCCSEWDLAVVLPKLQKLNLIPPDVKITDIKISIPNKNVTVISGVRTASCSQTIRVPKRLQQTGEFITITPGSSPLNISLAGYSVAEWADIGCASPAFGLEPISSTASVPDITRVKFEWRGINVQTGSVEVDMTRADFRGTCKKGCSDNFEVPEPTVKTGSVDLPWACLEPRLVNVVANQ